LPKITVIGFIASFIHFKSGRHTKIFNIREETIGIWGIGENEILLTISNYAPCGLLFLNLYNLSTGTLACKTVQSFKSRKPALTHVAC